jgi:hypothetical protein
MTMVTRTVAAHELQPGWIVLPETGQPRRITLARCEGAPPHVVVHWAGTDARTIYPASATVTIEQNR